MQMLTQRYFQLTAVHSAFVIHQESTESLLTHFNGDGLLENVEL